MEKMIVHLKGKLGYLSPYSECSISFYGAEYYKHLSYWYRYVTCKNCMKTKRYKDWLKRYKKEA